MTTSTLPQAVVALIRNIIIRIPVSITTTYEKNNMRKVKLLVRRKNSKILSLSITFSITTIVLKSITSPFRALSSSKSMPVTAIIQASSRLTKTHGRREGVPDLSTKAVTIITKFLN